MQFILVPCLKEDCPGSRRPCSTGAFWRGAAELLRSKRAPLPGRPAGILCWNVTIRELDVKPDRTFRRGGPPDDMSVLASHKRKSAIQHAFVAERPQELRKRTRLERLGSKLVRGRPAPPVRQSDCSRSRWRSAGAESKSRIEPGGAVGKPFALLRGILLEGPHHVFASPRQPFIGTSRARDKARREPDGAALERVRVRSLNTSSMPDRIPVASRRSRFPRYAERKRATSYRARAPIFRRIVPAAPRSGAV